jgi:predicted ATP-binding protein involved in virulence
VLGLNQNHNHDLKNIFKSAAISASSRPGPFQEFYAALLAKGRRPAMARLTLARRIAAIQRRTSQAIESHLQTVGWISRQKISRLPAEGEVFC